MPSALRSRLALFALLGAFLIPIAMSSMRGLTHVLTCQEPARASFTLITSETGPPLVGGATRLERGQELELCGGLLLDLRARGVGSDVAMVVEITNNTGFGWRGTINLLIGKLSIPVGIGEVPAGGTRADKVRLRLDPGTHELNGSLLIGP